MANDSPETESAGAPAAAAASGGEAKAQLGKGMILGKDGKPCRACNSFTAWHSQSKSLLKAAPGTPTTGAATKAARASASGQPSDCPPDVEVLGRSSWTLLHSIAAAYPDEPSRAEQDDVMNFMRLFSKLYPCWVCAEDFQAYMRKEPVRARSRDDLGMWLCRAHNDVNRKLRKPVFDCALWQERWRTGWKDGRCD